MRFGLFGVLCIILSGVLGALAGRHGATVGQVIGMGLAFGVVGAVLDIALPRKPDEKA